MNDPMRILKADHEWLALGDRLADAKRAAGMPVPQAPRRRSAKRTQSRGKSKSASRA